MAEPSSPPSPSPSPSPSPLPKKKITLKSSDNYFFQVEEDVASQSITLKNIIEEIHGVDSIPLPNVAFNVLAKVIVYCKKKTAALSSTLAKEDFQEYEADLVNQLKRNHNHDLLFDLVEAANYLNIPSLLDLTCKCVADIMEGKTPQQIRETFHVINDYTPEEEKEIKKELSGFLRRDRMA